MIPIEFLSRRKFIASGLGVAGALLFPVQKGQSFTSRPQKAYSIPVGICGSYEKAEMFAKAGYDFFEDNVGRFLVPDKPDSAFQEILEIHKKLPIKARSFVSFIPGSMKSVGPDVQHDAILTWADTALSRAKACGAKNIVFGSGGSRRIPDGFDAELAKRQFIDLCIKMGPIAGKHGITISLEPLNRRETNFINNLAEGAEIVQAVKHPWFRLLADVYHMMVEGEPPSEIVKYRKLLVHTHIAEKDKRTAPGLAGDDFRPYFRALQKIKFNEGIALECNWGDLEKEAAIGLETMRHQMADL
jgi:sugar phosphate isomerase/epimerase